MQLRAHPMLNALDRTWPPLWIPCDATIQQKTFQDEAGTLVDLKRQSLQDRYFFAYIEYGGNKYMGCIFADTPEFCSALFDLLETCIGRTIEQIGEIEVDGILPL